MIKTIQKLTRACWLCIAMLGSALLVGCVDDLQAAQASADDLDDAIALAERSIQREMTPEQAARRACVRKLGKNGELLQSMDTGEFICRRKETQNVPSNA